MSFFYSPESFFRHYLGENVQQGVSVRVHDVVALGLLVVHKELYGGHVLHLVHISKQHQYTFSNKGIFITILSFFLQ
jgi:hypothetical protein